MSMAWRDIGGAPEEELEEARLRLLSETLDPVTGLRDWSVWPRDVLAWHLRRNAAEKPYLRGGRTWFRNARE
jgi:hypothetical protein